jgi:molybdate transport system substrate-binding protein
LINQGSKIIPPASSFHVWFLPFLRDEFTQRRRILLVAFLTMMAYCLSACVNSTDQAQLFVAAAASLTNPLSEIGEEFTSGTGIGVTFTFASTGHLAQQIQNGAPYDIFAAADSVHIDTLIEGGYLLDQTRTYFAEGNLVLIFEPGYAFPVDFSNPIEDSKFTRLVIANPDHAPYGLAAKQFLQNSKVWDSIQDRLVFSENVRQAAQVVFTGNATAGIIAGSIVLTELTHGFPIDRDTHDPILHVAAASEKSEFPREVREFLAYLSSPISLEILDAHGLVPVGSE